MGFSNPTTTLGSGDLNPGLLGCVTQRHTCDVAIRIAGQDGSVGAHRLVLASLSPALMTYLAPSFQLGNEKVDLILDSGHGEERDGNCLTLSDVEHLIEGVYAGLTGTGQKDLEIEVSKNLYKAFGLLEPDYDQAEDYLEDINDLLDQCHDEDETCPDEPAVVESVVIPILKTQKAGHKRRPCPKIDQELSEAKRPRSDIRRSTRASKGRSSRAPGLISDHLDDSDQDNYQDDDFTLPAQDPFRQNDNGESDIDTNFDPDNDSLQCSICNKTMSDLKSLVRHKKHLHGEKKIGCPNCPEQFVTRYKLRCHLVVAHNRNQTPDGNSSAITYPLLFQLAGKKKPNLLPALEELTDIMEGVAEGNQNRSITDVMMLNPPYPKATSVRAVLQRSRSYFTALMAVKRISSEDDSLRFQARPLTWTNPMELNIKQQFLETTALLKRLYGFSEAQVFNHSIYVTAQGIDVAVTSRRERERAKRVHGKKSTEDLESLLKDCQEQIDILEKNTEPSESLKEPLPDRSSVDFELTGNLPIVEVQNLVIISWSQKGLMAFPMNETLEYVDLASRQCIKNLVAIWNKVPAFPFAKHEYERVNQPYNMQAALKSLQKPARTHICDNCGYTVVEKSRQDMARFKAHVQKHTTEKLDCGCGIEFTSISAKEHHMLHVHSGKETFQCSHARCSSVFQSRESLENHVRLHHTIGDHVCETCGTSFETQVRLSQHISQTHQVFRCEECDLAFVGNFRYRKHVNSIHLKKDSTVACDQCDMVLVSRQQLKKHLILRHTKNEDRPHRCGVCGKGFAEKGKLTRHLSTHKTGKGDPR